MNDEAEGERELRKSVRAERHDDDEEDVHIYIYILTLPMFWSSQEVSGVTFVFNLITFWLFCYIYEGIMKVFNPTQKRLTYFI